MSGNHTIIEGALRPRFGRRLSVTGRTRAVALVITVGLLSGCSSWKRHSIEVGSVPDDYRTNHPIVISEKEQTFDVPVATGERKLSLAQQGPVSGFIAEFDRSGAGTIYVLLPRGSVNEAAASRIGTQIERLITQRGIARSRIVFTSYQVTTANAAAPVRLSYSAITASTNQCGRWPKDIHNNPENKHYENFGCSYQNNLAAQIANPSDLLGPREVTEIDAANRGVVIDTYQNSEPEFIPNVRY